MTFDFDGVAVEFMPEDYLEQDGQYCRSLFVTDGEETEHVSLGAAFLKNVYLRLDFARNEIALANKDVDIPTAEEVEAAIEAARQQLEEQAAIAQEQEELE